MFVPGIFLVLGVFLNPIPSFLCAKIEYPAFPRGVDPSPIGRGCSIVEELNEEPKFEAVMRDLPQQVLESGPCFMDRFFFFDAEAEDFVSKC